MMRWGAKKCERSLVRRAAGIGIAYTIRFVELHGRQTDDIGLGAVSSLRTHCTAALQSLKFLALLQYGT
eukprot:scaffold4597_cov162-Amphora_coffeaeformis.AAC.3